MYKINSICKRVLVVINLFQVQGDLDGKVLKYLIYMNA